MAASGLFGAPRAWAVAVHLSRTDGCGLTGCTHLTLSFNDELLDLARDLGDYVIAHELVHFSAPNHGKLWKSLMRVHLGDWESVAARLPRIQIKTRNAS